ncbi:hypothetical protein [Clostridium sp. LP20]|uniref:hypothetical protein n=1 Tax=Clostridium sp. LP20 TaxID=3418665 RepID=UPI003EE46C1C
MSKRRRRDRSDENRNMRRNQGPGHMNNNPFGINPQQLLAMLGGNMDMGGLGNMLQSMNRDGFDLNSMNQHMNQQMNQQMNGNNAGNNGFNFNNIMGAMNNIRNNMNNNPINMNGGMNDINSGQGNMNTNVNDMNTNLNDFNFDLGKYNENDDSKIEENNEIRTSKSHKSKKKEAKISDKDNIDDENIQMLRSLRNIVDPTKVDFVDKMIEVYMNGGFKDI